MRNSKKELLISLAFSALLTTGVFAFDSVVVFNEIMYHPSEDADVEWVELHNLLSIDVDVSKWSISGIGYEFPVGTIIPADGYLVVADSPDVLSLLTGFNDAYGPFSGSLSNAGEQLKLINNGGRTMDVVDYRDEGDWPVAPDGSGVTLAKRRPTTASGVSENWTWSVQVGGTLGQVNFPDDDLKPITHELIQLHDNWLYDDSGTNNGSLWRQAGYDDNLWEVGPASFYSGQSVTGDTPTAITTLYSSGINDDGSVMSPGQDDPHYFITSNSTPVTVMQNHPAWVANDSISLWIGLSAQGTDNQPAGDYSFSTTFDMNGWLAETAEVSFMIAVDNELLDVKINGVSTGITSIGHDAFGGPFTVSNGFVTGVNQIDFIFQNWDSTANPMGLNVKIAGSALPVYGKTEVNSGPMTHYFRKPFVYDGEPGSSVSVELNHLVDDGAVFYLNDLEIYRYNIPGGVINYLTAASSDVIEPSLSGFISIPVNNMTVGDNLLAVEVHQSSQDNDVLFAAAVNATEMQAASAEPIKIAINELTGAGDAQFWVELVNYGETAIDVTGYAISCAGGVTGEYIFPSGTLNAGDYLTVSSGALGFWPGDEDRLFLYVPGKDAVLDAAVVKNSHRGRHPEATGRWQYPDSPTLGAENIFNFNDDIVINEVMYNHSYVSEQEAEFQTSTILSSGAQAAALVPGDDALGSTWTGANEPFDDDDWDSGTGSTTGVGYERDVSGDYDNWIGTNVHDDMYNVNASIYVRMPFDVSAVDGIEELTLKMIYDDAFIAYLNGEEVARSSYVPSLVQWNSQATDGHEATAFENFDITEHLDALVEGENILALHGFNFGKTSSDMILLPELQVSQQISPWIEGGESSEEWIELYNKGDSTIDLTGWKLTDAIDYNFETGTEIDPDEYIVIANQAPEMAAKYPDIRIVGEYDGRLTNKTERIVLVDDNKNLADQVRYFDGKPWPDFADGYSASLELRNPRSDNAQATAWRESDEGRATSWKTYTYRGTAQPSAVGPDGQWSEFILGLLDAGEVLLDDISVIEDYDGAAIELIQNGTFESGTSDKWRMLGNHSHSEIIADPNDNSNHVLRFIATGTTGHLHNHAETTLANGRSIANGTQYEISFKAKWVAGSNQLNSRLYFNRLPRTTLIDRPEMNGSPGVQNTRYQADVGPTFSDLSHFPPVPFESEPVTVSVAATDPDGVASMTLRWRIDGQSWNSVAMTIDGAGTGTGQIPPQPAATVVQFYLQASDGPGNVAMFPPAGPDSRAMYKVDDGLAADNGLHNVRIIMNADDYNWMHTNINLMSNDRVGATVIYEENEIFYDVGVRLKSSQRHRHEPDNVGFNLRFPSDNLFGGVHETIAIDRSEGTYPGQQEMLINLVMNRVGNGQLSKYSDLIKVIAPSIQHTSSGELQMARFRSGFLDGQFENGSDGQVYEYELIYYPYLTLSGDPEDYKIPQPDYVIFDIAVRDYGSDKENYRWQFLKKNNRTQDYYQSLIDFAKKFGTTGPQFNDNVAEMIDVDQWLNNFAIAVASGAGDQYGFNSQHNAQFYIRPSDGRALYFPHDLDAFYSSTRPLIGNSDLSKIIANPGYERLYYGHVHDVLGTAYNATYMQHWTDQFGAMLPSQPFDSHLSFIQQRNNYLSSELANRVAPEYPFEITGYDAMVDDVYAQVNGNAWINIRDVYLQGHDLPLELSWTSTGSDTSKVFHWSTNVPLEPGVNDLVFLVYDFQGNLIHTEMITITSTVTERPLRDYLRVTELMYDAPGGEDYEFIELCNIGPDPLDVSAVTLAGGITFNFIDGAVTSLQPGQYVVVVEDIDEFQSRYGNAITLAGQYGGSLSNGGEDIVIRGRYDAEIISFEYNDSRSWPPAADGPGHSLVPLAPALADEPAGSLNYGGNWRASAYIKGSPGSADPEPPAGVVLNEIMAHTDYDIPPYDSNDWIELYNASALAVQLNGDWYLSDDGDELKKWTLPNTPLESNGMIVFDEVTGFHNPITTGFGLSKAGERVYLSYLPGTDQDRVVDCIRFKGQESDISLGRFPDGHRYWRKLAPTRNMPNVDPIINVLVSEIMYRADAPELEYVELFNPVDATILIQNNVGAWRLDGCVEYVFDEGLSLDAYGRLLVVGFDPVVRTDLLAAFQETYATGPLTAGVDVVGPFEVELDDITGRVAVERPQAPDALGDPVSWSILDETIYFHRSPWPAISDEAGASLQRQPSLLAGNDPVGWRSAPPTPVHPPAITEDINADGNVNFLDFSALARAWLSELNDPGWNQACDLADPLDGVVDFADLVSLVEKWLMQSKSIP
jgi:lamin tail-like protein/CotH protein